MYVGFRAALNEKNVYIDQRDDMTSVSWMYFAREISKSKSPGT